LSLYLWYKIVESFAELAINSNRKEVKHCNVNFKGGTEFYPVLKDKEKHKEIIRK